MCAVDNPIGSTIGQRGAEAMFDFHPCRGTGPHDLAVGPDHAVCNRCEKVITLNADDGRMGEQSDALERLREERDHLQRMWDSECELHAACDQRGARNESEIARLRETVAEVHAIKRALAESCFLDDEVRAAAQQHPGWVAWSDAYSRLFDVDTRPEGNADG